MYMDMVGNKCGHDKGNPISFKKPSSHKGRPHIIEIACENAKKFYEEPDKFLPRLRFANGKDTQQRSERREAASSVMQVLLHYTDLSTLEVGTPTKDGSINGLRLGFIADKIEMGVKRVWRAVKDLKSAGYIKMRSMFFRIKDRAFIISKIFLFPKTFHDLGVSTERLNLSQHYKRKSLSKRKPAIDFSFTRTKAAVRAATSAIVKMGQIINTSVKKPINNYKKVSCKNDRRNRADIIKDLMLNKGMSTQEIRAYLGETSPLQTA